MKFFAKTVIFAGLICLAGQVLASELVREFKGSRSMDTGEFEVQAPWILDWRVGGEFSNAMAVDVSLMEAGTGVHQGIVLKSKIAGNGVRLFNQDGKFYFQVNSALANWTLKVEQLTREEAESYTPKSNGDSR